MSGEIAEGFAERRISDNRNGRQGVTNLQFLNSLQLCMKKHPHFLNLALPRCSKACKIDGEGIFGRCT